MQARQRYSRDPVHMDRLHGLQTDMNCAVDRRSRACKDAGDRKGFVRMIGSKIHFASAMRQGNALIDPITQAVGNLGADHCIIEIAKALPLTQLQRLLLTVAEVLEISSRGAQHRKTLV